MNKFWAIIKEGALSDGSATALQFGTMEGSLTSYSRAQVWLRICLIASQVRRAGWQRKRIGISVERVEDQVFTFLGLLLGGAIPSIHSAESLSPMLTGKTEAKPSIDAWVGDDEIVHKLLNCSAHAKSVLWLESNPPFENDIASDSIPHDDEVAFVQYTSGSTGLPKGIAISYRSIAANSDMIGAAFRTSPLSKGLSWLPLNHDMGLVGGLLHPLYSGFPVYLESPKWFVRSPLQWLKAISNHQITISGAPTFAYELCTKAAARSRLRLDFNLEAWSTAFVGAERLSYETLRRFHETFAPVGFSEPSLTPCYGLAEATLLVAGGVRHNVAKMRTFSSHSLASNVFTNAAEGSSSSLVLMNCGEIAPGVRIKVMNPETLEQRLDGEIGEIFIASPSLATRYTDSTDELPLHRFNDEDGSYLRSGDMGFTHQNHLWITGRRKELIIQRGRKFDPVDLETIIKNTGGQLIRRCVVFSVAEERGENIVVAIETANRTSKVTTDRISHLICSELLERLGIAVGDIVFLPPRTLPRTTSGKMRRQRCVELYTLGEWNSHRTEPSAVALDNVDTPIDPRLRTAIEHLLDTALPPNYSSWCSLGLDSVDILRLCGMAKEIYCVNVTYEEAMKATGPLGLHNLLQSRKESLQTELKHAPSDPYVLTPGEEALWLWSEFNQGSALYNLPLSFRINSPLSLDSLTRRASLALRGDSFIGARVQLVCNQPRFEPSSCPLTITTHGLLSLDNAARKFEESSSQPFNLNEGPLARIFACPLIEGGYFMGIVVHHLVCDLDSGRLLIERFMKAIDGAEEADHARVDPFPSSRQRDDSEQITESYWKRQGLKLKNLQRQSFSFSLRPIKRGCITLPPEVVDSMVTLARSFNVTKHEYLFYVFAKSLLGLLKRSTGIFGIPTTTRTSPDDWQRVGHFANIVPHIFDTSDSVHTSSERLRETLSFRDAPLHEIRRRLEIPFQVEFPLVTFSWRGARSRIESLFNGIIAGDSRSILKSTTTTIESIPSHSSYRVSPLTCNVFELSGSILVTIEDCGILPETMNMGQLTTALQENIQKFML